jgi:hypothetical protein
MAKWKELSDIGIPISTPSPEAIVKAALERASEKLEAWADVYSDLAPSSKLIRDLASDRAEVAAIIKKAGEDRG